MEKVKCFFATTGAVIISFIVVMVFFLSISDDNPSNLFFVCLFLCLIFIPVFSGVFVFKKTRKNVASCAKKESSENYGKKTRWPMDSKGKLQLVGGLMDLPNGTICKVLYNEDRIIFSASGQEFTLNAEKMLDVSVMTPTEIQKQYVSSIGGAVAGAVLLGPLGAIIGGSASKKTVKNKMKYLVISYVSGGDTKYIVFDVTAAPGIGRNMQSTFRYLKKRKKVQIDL